MLREIKNEKVDEVNETEYPPYITDIKQQKNDERNGV
jgi:hypothetical protein